MTVRQRVVSPEISMIALRTVVAVGAADALGSPDGLLRGVQQAIQHLADRAVFAVERIGVHDADLPFESLCAESDSPRIRVAPFSHARKDSLELQLVNPSDRRSLALGTICTLFT